MSVTSERATAVPVTVGSSGLPDIASNLTWDPPSSETLSLDPEGRGNTSLIVRARIDGSFTCSESATITLPVSFNKSFPFHTWAGASISKPIPSEGLRVPAGAYPNGYPVDGSWARAGNLTFHAAWHLAEAPPDGRERYNLVVAPSFVTISPKDACTPQPTASTHDGSAWITVVRSGPPTMSASGSAPAKSPLETAPWIALVLVTLAIVRRRPRKR